MSTSEQNRNQDAAVSRNFFASPAFISLLLAVVTFAVYFPTLRNQFVNYDDQDYVTSNTHVKEGLTGQGILWAFTSGHASNWHPLTWITHMLDCQVSGLNPLAHHLTNILFHIGATVFLFLALYRMTAARWASAFVAGVFALHPMHVESVAWVSERKDVLSAFFGMLTLWFYGSYAARTKATNPRAKIDYVFALISFALGLMAKPMLVTSTLR